MQRPECPCRTEGNCFETLDLPVSVLLSCPLSSQPLNLLDSECSTVVPSNPSPCSSSCAYDNTSMCPLSQRLPSPPAHLSYKCSACGFRVKLHADTDSIATETVGADTKAVPADRWNIFADSIFTEGWMETEKKKEEKSRSKAEPCWEDERS